MPMIPPRADVVPASTTNRTQDRSFLGTQCLADADLTGALGNRDHHDVHDADAADQQRDGRNGRQDRDHHVDHARHHIQHLAQADDHIAAVRVKQLLQAILNDGLPLEIFSSSDTRTA